MLRVPDFALIGGVGYPLGSLEVGWKNVEASVVISHVSVSAHGASVC